MIRIRSAFALLALLLVWPSARADYSLKEAASVPPMELDKSIRDALSDKAVQILDAKKELFAEVWLRKELPTTATEVQAKNGLTYREMAEGTLFAAIRFPNQIEDYRKNKIKAGVYTLRLAFQPEDGDHMGTAPYPNFCLLIGAAKDKKLDGLKDTKELREASIETVGESHPGVMLLFPMKNPGVAVKLLNDPAKHWVLAYKQEVLVEGKKSTFYIGLGLIGTSPAA